MSFATMRRIWAEAYVLEAQALRLHAQAERTWKNGSEPYAVALEEFARRKDIAAIESVREAEEHEARAVRA